MRIPAAYLTRLRACSEQVAIFRSEWPGGAKVNDVTALRALELQLDLTWLAQRCLSDPARRAYNEAIAPASRAYNEAIAPARRAYDEAFASARRAYNEAIAPASRAYDEAIASASRAYDEAIAPASRAYDEAFASAFAAAWLIDHPVE